MPAPDRVLAVVREWVVKAENDLTNAAHVLKLAAECPSDTVCFHAQQCVEKYLKALLVLDGIDFPKTHDIERLTALLGAGRYSPDRRGTRKANRLRHHNAISRHRRDPPHRGNLLPSEVRQIRRGRP